MTSRLGPYFALWADYAADQSANSLIGPDLSPTISPGWLNKSLWMPHALEASTGRGIRIL